MTATITAPAVPLSEQEAAAAEGLVEMPVDLVALRNRKLALDEQKDAIIAEIDQIKATFDQRMAAYGVQGFVLNGKVHARRSEVKTSRVDTKKLKEAHPRIFAAFLKVTESVRITIN